MRNWFTTLAAILMLCAVSVVARAETLPAGDYYIVAKHSQKALTAFEYDDGETYLGQSVRREEMGDAQIWTITPAGGRSDADSYTIRSRKYGTALSPGGENDNGDTGVVLSRQSSAKVAVWRLR